VRQLCHTAQPGQPFRRRAFRRSFTIVIRSFTGGPSHNQMEDASTKAAIGRRDARQCAVQPDRGRV